ncbi:hypothetical protein Bca4012_050342 [Brassica carinata]
MDSFLILLKEKKGVLWTGLRELTKQLDLDSARVYSALIIYPNELSKAAQLLLAKAKSFKEVSKKWCYAFEFVELGLSKSDVKNNFLRTKEATANA